MISKKKNRKRENKDQKDQDTKSILEDLTSRMTQVLNQTPTQVQTPSHDYTTQIGIKSMINSIYGICGTKFSPIANPDMA